MFSHSTFCKLKVKGLTTKRFLGLCLPLVGISVCVLIYLKLDVLAVTRRRFTLISLRFPGKTSWFVKRVPDLESSRSGKQDSNKNILTDEYARRHEDVFRKLADIHKAYSDATDDDEIDDLGLLKDPKLQICNKGGADSIEDLLCMKPLNFLSKFRNPCWYSGNDTLRCLPYFQIIGVDKSGTSDLFARITKHPDVLNNSGVIDKETMWWSWLLYGHHINDKRARLSFLQYQVFFDNASRIIEKSIDKNGFHHLITGDGTPMDFWDFSGWPNIPQNTRLTAPKVLTPHLIRHINPEVKLIVIFREPVERLYSDYYFLAKGRMNRAGFHNAVIESIDLLHNCTQRVSLKSCLFDGHIHAQMKARLHVGFYPIFLKEWLKVFPRRQLLFLQTEEYSRDTSNMMKTVFRYLNLRSPSPQEMSAIMAQNRTHETKRKKNAKPMLEESRHILHKLYAPFVLELASILKSSIFSWNVTTATLS